MKLITTTILDRIKLFTEGFNFILIFLLNYFKDNQTFFCKKINNKFNLEILSLYSGLGDQSIIRINIPAIPPAIAPLTDKKFNSPIGATFLIA